MGLISYRGGDKWRSLKMVTMGEWLYWWIQLSTYMYLTKNDVQKERLVTPRSLKSLYSPE